MHMKICPVMSLPPLWLCSNMAYPILKRVPSNMLLFSWFSFWLYSHGHCCTKVPIHSNCGRCWRWLSLIPFDVCMTVWIYWHIHTIITMALELSQMPFMRWNSITEWCLTLIYTLLLFFSSCPSMMSGGCIMIWPKSPTVYIWYCL